MGPFYPPGTTPAGSLSEYAKRFDTVEVDSTLYRTPSRAIAENWRDCTPPGFTCAAKFPRVITHDKVMEDCSGELEEFLDVMALLGDKLGPLLLQFPYFNRQAFAQAEDFIARLEPFLDKLPSGFSFAVEIRNEGWIGPRLLEALRRRNVALALIDHPWMTPIPQLAAKLDVVAADFTYMRWLGDRKGIEEQTKRWNRIIVDREREMETWVPEIRKLLACRTRVYGYFNNHNAGFAPGSITLFHQVWRRLP